MNFYENLEDAMKNLTTRGAFLTVKNNQGVNTMTISWGYIGFSWNKPYFVAMVRPQRYTYEFLKYPQFITSLNIHLAKLLCFLIKYATI